jgi:recombinational DNA repair protein RecR
MANSFARVSKETICNLKKQFPDVSIENAIKRMMDMTNTQQDEISALKMELHKARQSSGQIGVGGKIKELEQRIATLEERRENGIFMSQEDASSFDYEVHKAQYGADKGDGHINVGGAEEAIYGKKKVTNYYIDENGHVVRE